MFPGIGSQSNISDLFSSERYVMSFTGYKVEMPSEEEIAAADFGEFNPAVRWRMAAMADFAKYFAMANFLRNE